MYEFDLTNIEMQQAIRQREAAQERLKNALIAHNKKNQPDLWRRFFRLAQK